MDNDERTKMCFPNQLAKLTAVRDPIAEMRRREVYRERDKWDKERKGMEKGTDASRGLLSPQRNL